ASGWSGRRDFRRTRTGTSGPASTSRRCCANPGRAAEMGALLGLVFGIGLLLIWRSGPRRPPRSARTASWNRNRNELLRQAGIEAVTSGQLLVMQFGCAVVVALVVLVATHTVSISACFALIAAFGPAALVRRLRDRRSVELRDVWPEVIDHLASGVRAGL